MAKSTLQKSLSKKSNLAPHIIVEALAGTGKTTTLIEGLKFMQGLPTCIAPSAQQQAVWEAMKKGPTPNSVNFTAFNASIAAELEQKVPDGMSAMTMHKMGNKAVRGSFKLRGSGINKYRVEDIIEELTGESKWDLKKKEGEFLKSVQHIVGLCKVNLCSGTEKEIDELTRYYDIDLNGNRSKICDYVPKILERCQDVDKDGMIDFNDMIWLPVVLGLPCTKYDLLLWDEAQDGNRCQQALAKMCGHRLLLCGDMNQAIYGFAGADAESLKRMHQELSETKAGVEVYPLTVTRRCSQTVVAEAQRIVPAFEAYHENPVGSRLYFSMNVPDGSEEQSYRSVVQPGDMIICRVNAPLVSECFKLLKDGKKANIAGRDIGTNLIGRINRMFKSEFKGVATKDYERMFKSVSTRDFLTKLDEWTSQETAKENARKHPSELKIAVIEDTSMCLSFFAEDCDTVADVINQIKEIFTDNETDGILLSSIHKSKGLEARSVFFLRPKGGECPHPMAKLPWEREQEQNLLYVGITRAIENICWVQ